ncbi:zinc finger protein 385B-like [Puntigrus tetrazona]|uniref:zinc finger protein 385B-like n=1 Tax=Puntigrus tetrazona TaxID=1606681 RepID=UPI001C891820|nr:zinc finger protein 385B-like [Puntigrus tetrazona]
MQNSEGMKTPLSPTQLIENGQLCFGIPGCVEVKDPSDSNIDMQLQQEKKKLLYSLCEVCNIQLHSAAQAQVHFNGKSHLKRVKQLNNGELPTASVSSAPAPLHSLSSGGSQESSKPASWPDQGTDTDEMERNVNGEHSRTLLQRKFLS